VRANPVHAAQDARSPSVFRHVSSSSICDLLRKGNTQHGDGIRRAQSNEFATLQNSWNKTRIFAANFRQMFLHVRRLGEEDDFANYFRSSHHRISIADACGPTNIVRQLRVRLESENQLCPTSPAMWGSRPFTSSRGNGHGVPDTGRLRLRHADGQRSPNDQPTWMMALRQSSRTARRFSAEQYPISSRAKNNSHYGS
jgi:hypothetical protein